MLGKLPVQGRPTNLDYSRARAFCACSRCGWDCLAIFLSSPGDAIVLGKLPVQGRPTNLVLTLQFEDGRVLRWAR